MDNVGNPNSERAKVEVHGLDNVYVSRELHSASLKEKRG